MLKKNSLLKPFVLLNICISIGIVLFMIPVTFIANKQISEQNSKINSYVLDESKNTLENCMKEAIKAVSALSANGNLKMVLDNIENSSYSNYDVMQLSKAIEDIYIRTENIANLSVYVREKDLFLCKNGVLTPKKYYDVFFEECDNYDEWHEKIKGDHEINICNSGQADSARLFYKADLVNKLFLPCEIGIIAEFKSDSVRKAVENIAVHTNACIGITFVDSGESIFSSNTSDAEKLFDGSDGKRYVYIRDDSPGYGIEYVMMLKKINYMRYNYILWSLFIIAIIVSVVFAGVYGKISVKRVFHPLNDILESSDFKSFKGDNSVNLHEFNILKLYIRRLIRNETDEKNKMLFWSMMSNSSSVSPENYGDYFNNDEFLVISVRPFFEDIDELKAQHYEEGDINTIFINIIEELLQDKYIVVSNCINGDYCYLINGNKFTSDILTEIFENVKEQIKKYFQVRLSVGVGSSVNGVQNISDSYKKSVDAVLYSEKFKDGEITFFDKLESGAWIAEPYFTRFESLIVRYASDGRYDEAYELVEQLLDRVCNMELFNKYVVFYLHKLFKSIIKRTLPISEHMQSIENELNELFLYVNSTDELKEKCKKFFELLMSVCEESKQEEREGRIRAFIDENYGDASLSVTMIADKFELHSVYLSKLFKNKFGIGVLEYITKVRIDNSKKLLLETDMKIANVAQKVGYTSIHTFSRVFKSHTGMSPGAFRSKYTR